MKSNDTTKFVNKLNRETKENKVLWEIKNSSPSSLANDERILNNTHYLAKIDNKQGVRLYKFQSKYYTDEDTYSWSDNLRLEFIDSFSNSTWEFPNDAATLSLYETVRYKTAGVESFLDSYLNNEPNELEAQSDEDNPDYPF